MCHSDSPHNPLFCIVPPYIREHIAEHGTDTQRHRAVETMSIDGTYRTIRAIRLAQPVEQVHSVMPIARSGGQKIRTISSAHNLRNLPGDIVRSEGGSATNDPAVDEAYDGLGDTYDFFWEEYQRDSIDGAGVPLDATVHYGNDENNAYWNGQRMIFGDGDGELFNRFTLSLDVIGHELAHGITSNEAQLVYADQPGALNEHISDVFGSLVKQRKLKQTAEQADWLIGEGLFTNDVNGVALRSMKAPGTAFDDPVLGKDPQPSHMRNYVQTDADYGGVHINSGIPNHAFYQVAAKLGGTAWDRAGFMWYEALRDSRLRADATFPAFARLTLSAALRIYGENTAEYKAVREGWAEVGITI